MAGSAPRISRAPVVIVAAFFAVAIALVLIGAQRSLDPAPEIAIDRPGTPESPRAVTVVMHDYRFDPTPLVLIPGETIRLTVFNGGLVSHELALGEREMQLAWQRADAAASPPAPFTTAPPASVPPGTGGWRLLVGSGRQAVLELTVPATGTLLLLCNLPGHIERGMVGRVELRSPAPGPTG